MKPLPNNFESNSSLPIIWKWGKRAGFSILDQGLFSGANFVLSILLGRKLLPEVYGAYAIASSIMLIIAGIQSALIFEPMMVYGPTKFKSNLSNYISKLSKLQLAITIPLSIVLIACSLFLKNPVKEALLGMAVVIPFYLAFWFLRQSCYIESKSGLAAISSSIYFVVSFVGIFILIFTNQLTLSSYYLLVIVSSIIGLTYLSYVIIYKGSKTLGEFTYKEISSVHWNYGRWILPATIANSVAVLIIAPVYGLLRGLGEAGAFKAFQNLTTPISQLFVALNLLSLPLLSRTRSEVGERAAGKQFLKLFQVYTGLLIFYLIPLHVWGNSIIFWLYKNTYYLSFSEVIIFIEILITLYVPAFLLGLRARYQERPKSILFAKIGSAVVTILLIGPLISNLGLAGAILVLMLGLIVEITSLLMTARTKTI